jgi:hypothetical protein
MRGISPALRSGSVLRCREREIKSEVKLLCCLLGCIIKCIEAALAQDRGESAVLAGFASLFYLVCLVIYP